jgi:D-galactose 1-dehydrogenase
MAPIRTVIVGLGKIAHDQHLPAIQSDARFHLAATVSPQPAGLSGIPHFADLGELLADGPELDAAIICTPPQFRHDLASACLARGLHVFLEKPPAATLGEIESLQAQAAPSGRTLFAAWHSRYAPGVEPARRWLEGRHIRHISIIWREDVRVWHPGQDWIWQPGGLGVFDPGINALSILTRLSPHTMYVTAASLQFPANRAAPIAAQLAIHCTGDFEIAADLDFRQEGPQQWDIVVQTDDGRATLGAGGAALSLPSGTQRMESREYSGLYAEFARLIESGSSDVDVGPLRLVADAFLIARREDVEAFDERK